MKGETETEDICYPLSILALKLSLSLSLVCNNNKAGKLIIARCNYVSDVMGEFIYVRLMRRKYTVLPPTDSPTLTDSDFQTGAAAMIPPTNQARATYQIVKILIPRLDRLNDQTLSPHSFSLSCTRIHAHACASNDTVSSPLPLYIRTLAYASRSQCPPHAHILTSFAAALRRKFCNEFSTHRGR